MEWIFAALMFLFAGSSDPSVSGDPSTFETTLAPSSEGEVSMQTGGGGFPDPRR